MSHNIREPFWPWYARSGRRDGRSVKPFRRFLSLGVTLGLLVCFYWLQPLWAKNIYVSLVRHHAIAVLGFVLAFTAMNFRATAVDYLAFATGTLQASPIPWRMIRDETNVRQNYEHQYGRDAYYRMPVAFGILSIITFLISGLGLVFSH